MLVYGSVMLPIGKFYYQVAVDTFQGSKISSPQGMFEDGFPFRQVRYVSSPEGIEHLSYEHGFSPGPVLQPIYLRELDWSMFSFKAMVICPENRKK